MFGIKESEQSTEITVSNDGICEMLNDVPLGSESPGLEEEMIEICKITGETVKTQRVLIKKTQQ